MTKPDEIIPDPSCMDDFDPNSVRVEQALERMQAFIAPISDRVRVPVRDALWRVLADDVTAAINVPNHDNSAMDGYAVAGTDLPADGTTTLHVTGTSWAGKPFDGEVTSGNAVRIMTGGVIPAGADTIVIQEDCERDGDQLRIGAGHRVGQHVRTKGDDVMAGAVVLPKGKRIIPADVGLLATVGVGEVNCVRRPRVAFMSTGDELRAIGETLNTGDVYDSNRYSLHAMLERLGVELLDMGVIRDDRDDVREAFSRAAKIADAVVVSGGASVGDADFVHETLNELGTVDFWKMAMKPGRPLAFGRIDNALFFGLPGNPVSVMVTFYQFVTPALKRLMGLTETMPVRMPVRLADPIKKSPGRLEFQRGILRPDAKGQMQVHTTGGQGSHILTSMSRANCFIILPLESGDIEAGEIVDVEPFEGLV